MVLCVAACSVDLELLCPPQRRSLAIGDRLIDELAQHLIRGQRRLAVGGNLAQPGALFVAQADFHHAAVAYRRSQLRIFLSSAPIIGPTLLLGGRSRADDDDDALHARAPEGRDGPLEERDAGDAGERLGTPPRRKLDPAARMTATGTPRRGSDGPRPISSWGSWLSGCEMLSTVVMRPARRFFQMD
jgi:hypothetical protein